MEPNLCFCCILLQDIPERGVLAEIENNDPDSKEFEMSLSDTQVFIALVVALIPGVLAFRLATELYK